jgi:hypothetical protein
LIAAATKEGKVVYYTSVLLTLAEKLAQAPSGVGCLSQTTDSSVLCRL